MSTILRTLRNLRRIGIRDYLHQMQYIGDTKAGTYIASDRYGNKYYENVDDELPLRTRWVDYKEKEYSPYVLLFPLLPFLLDFGTGAILVGHNRCQIEPGWHAWMSYLVDKPPTADAVLRPGQRTWELPEHRPNLTASRAAFKTYSTVKPKTAAWDPMAAPR
ncbi:MAG: hypothetical protein Q9166_001196 [cf. Caloplaca sp. 2 TL-2023]